MFVPVLIQTSKFSLSPSLSLILAVLNAMSWGILVILWSYGDISDSVSQQSLVIITIRTKRESI